LTRQTFAIYGMSKWCLGDGRRDTEKFDVVPLLMDILLSFAGT
jgi:hypothetical protein